MPVLGARLASKSESASMPPAEAPMAALRRLLLFAAYGAPDLRRAERLFFR
jgi:hypothetical protein